ncbi:DUF4365 domain-containing protein [Dyadobacter sp. LJ53]|uniref:DUF4365 domain-containing protein n=1 Tax=Dyadobacter chenwenxiniae TaxID=2906456 RepID=UPI001F275EA1|nr:DUF4365 domain-containing protein [Dyadobacter chenwenxiniae]MCF0049565.1 DUF4365 domain-containing protein [Dyadobacter chenwenxiniae]
MLTENKIKEEISLAYVLAVAAIKKFSTEITRVDNDSVDATIKYSGYLDENSTLYSPEIKLQLKATSKPTIHGDQIHFALPIKNYNDLRARSGTPRLLVVLCLCDSSDEWLMHSPDKLILKRCAYFINLRNYPDSENETSVTIKIPTTNLFSPEQVYELMLKTSKEEEL